MSDEFRDDKISRAKAGSTVAKPSRDSSGTADHLNEAPDCDHEWIDNTSIQSQIDNAGAKTFLCLKCGFERLG